MLRGTLGALAAVALSTVGGVAWAQAHLNKSVRLVLPFATGGATDIIVRVWAETVGLAFGQSVIVENKAGGGPIGAIDAARATVSTPAANPAINPKLPHNLLTGFTPSTCIAAAPIGMAVHRRFPARDHKTFIAGPGNTPCKHSCANFAAGGKGHLQTKLLKNLAGVFIAHMPYRGAGPALSDTAARLVQIVFHNLPSVLPFIKDGRAIPIAAAAAQELTLD